MLEKLEPGRFLRRLRRSLARNPQSVAAWAAVAVLAAIAAWQVLPDQFDEGAPDTVDSVVVLGVPGLTWSDIDAETTPNLNELASGASLAELRSDSARSLTCPLDGWLTFSAGGPAVGADLSEPVCEPISADAVTVEDGTGTITGFADLVELNRSLSSQTELGILAAGTSCATAVGTGAAYALSNTVGRVGDYEPVLPTDADLAETLAMCPLTVIDGGMLPGGGDARTEALAALDETVAAVNAARADSSALIVTGISQTGEPNRLLATVAAIDGEGGHDLLDLTAERPGYIGLTDLTATILALLESPSPDTASGTAAGITADELSYAERHAVFDDTDARLTAANFAAPNAQWLMVLLFLLLTVVAWPLLRLLRHAGQPGVKPPSLWLMRANIVVALVCALYGGAGILADFTNWWEASRPGLWGPLVALGISAVCAVAAIIVPRRHSPAGLMVTVSAFGVLVTFLAMLVHGAAPLGTLLGDYTVADSASSSIGPVVTGIFIAALWLLAAAAAWPLPRHLQSPAMAAIGCIGVLVAAMGFLGASTPAAVAIIIGTCLAAALATGGWFTFGRLAWSVMAGAGVLVVLSWIDYLNPENERGPMGAVAADLVGESSGIIGAGAGSNLVSVFTSPLSVLTILAGLYCWLVLLRPGGGLRRAFGLYPPLRAAFSAAVVGATCAGLLLGKGFMSLGTALAVMVPLAVIISHRVLARAHVKDGQYSDMIVDAPSWVDEANAEESVSVESRG